MKNVPQFAVYISLFFVLLCSLFSAYTSTSYLGEGVEGFSKHFRG